MTTISRRPETSTTGAPSQAAVDAKASVEATAEGAAPAETWAGSSAGSFEPAALPGSSLRHIIGGPGFARAKLQEPQAKHLPSPLLPDASDLYTEKKITKLVDTIGKALLKKGKIDAAGVREFAERLSQGGPTRGLDDCKVNELRWWFDDHKASFTDSGKVAIRKIVTGKRIEEPIEGVVQPEDPHAQPACDQDFTYKAVHGPLFEGTAKPEDVLQRGVGDCYLLSSLAAIADVHPELIRDMIREDANGIYTVRFFVKNDELHDATPVEIKVDNKLLFRDGSLMSAGKEDGSGALWPAIIEKAYAKLRGSYANATSDYPGAAFTAITGRPSSELPIFTDSNADKVFKAIKNGENHHQAMAAWTYCPDQTGKANPTVSYDDTGLVGGHAYTVLGAVEKDGRKYIKLRNPWGSFEPKNDGVDDGEFLLEVSEFLKYFAETTFLGVPANA